MLDLTVESETEDDLDSNQQQQTRRVKGGTGTGSGSGGRGGGVVDLTEDIDSPNRTESDQSSIGIGGSDSEEDEELGLQVHEEDMIPTVNLSHVNGDIMMNGLSSQEASHSQLQGSINSPNLIIDNSSNNYLSAVSKRQAIISPSVDLHKAKSYSIESIFTMPQATHTHTLAMPPCSSHLFTGGGDGIIRRYALHATLNQTLSEINAPNNITMKSGTMGGGTGEMKLPVLIGCYENEEPGTWAQEDLVGGGDSDKDGSKKQFWGPKNFAMRESPVYSLAVHSEELWGLSGTAKGTINLFTIRQDEGQIRHVFQSSDNIASLGHHSKSPVSALAISPDQHSFLSGGWDSRILEWDLDTGIVSNEYAGHTGQISSISYRPTALSSTTFTSQSESTEDVEMDILPSNPPLSINTFTTLPLSSIDPPPLTSPVSSPDSATGIAAALVLPSTNNSSNVPTPKVTSTPATTGGAGGEEDADADGSELDADADGDDDDDLMTGAGSSTTTTTTTTTSLGTTSIPKPFLTGAVPLLKKKNVVFDSIPIINTESEEEEEKLKELSSEGGDVFLSSSIDGQVIIWDKRIRNGGSSTLGGVRRFGDTVNSNWCASVSWSSSGQEIYVGRRNALVEIYDVRHSTPSNPVLQTLRMPSYSGPVTAVIGLPSGKHLLSGSSDSVRLWDLEVAKNMEGRSSTSSAVPWRIVAGHQGATAMGLPNSVVSQLYIDPRAKFLVSSSGNRGWEGTSTETVIIYEIKATY